MNIKCDNCGNVYEAKTEKCPICGSLFNERNFVAECIPDTIEALEEFISSNNIDMKKLKLYINEDTTQAGAYGMIKDKNGDFTFFRNRSDGTRSIRYRGSNEAFAVNEFYRSLIAVMSEVSLKPEDILEKSPAGRAKRSPRRIVFTVFGAILVLGIFFIFLTALFSALHGNDDKAANGYYKYFGKTYYYDGAAWYEDAGDDKWIPAELDQSFLNGVEKYVDQDYSGEEFDYYKFEGESESETIDYFTEPTEEGYQTNKYGEEIVTDEFGEEFYPDELISDEEPLFEQE